VPPQTPAVQTSLKVQATPSTQPVPSVLAPPSMQVWTPVEQEVVPFLQMLGLVVHETPAEHATQVPPALQTMLVPQVVPVIFCVLLTHAIVPVVQVVRPVKQGFGFVVQAWFAVHVPQFPLPSQTMFVPQLVPPILLLPSTQVWAPVAQEFVPFLQMLGLVVQEPLAVQETQVPEPLQTMLVPQLVPAILLLPSTQVWAPVVQEVVPFLQVLFGLVLQATPAAHETQVPEPLQTMFVPQLVPGDLSPPSMQVRAPVAHEVTPLLQALLGLVPQATPAVHETQVPAPLHTRFVPQATPGDLFVSSAQVWAPVAQEVAPFLQMLGLVAQAPPAVQAAQVPAPLQTMLVPQLVPPAFAVPLTHIGAPVMHDATPLSQEFGLPEQLCPSVQVPQNPLPSQTRLVPQGVPPMTLPVPSTQTGAPVEHEVTPLLHGDELPPQTPPAEHATQLLEPLQTLLVPQAVPGALAVPSTQVSTPVLHEVTPLTHAGLGFVAHA